MDYPTRIKTGCHMFNLRAMTIDEMRYSGALGSCDCDNLSIIIDTSSHASLQVESIIHELTHAIFWTYNIRKKNGEEHIVKTLANGLTQVLTDNKHLQDLLFTESLHPVSNKKG